MVVYSSYVVARIWARFFLLLAVILLNVYKLRMLHTHIEDIQKRAETTSPLLRQKIKRAAKEEVRQWNTHVIWPLYGSMFIVSGYWLFTILDLYRYHSQRRQTVVGV